MEPSSKSEAFLNDGFCVLEGLLPPSLLDGLREEAVRLFDECMGQINDRGLTLGVGAKEGYAEIVQRHPGRFEMRYGLQRRGRRQASALFERAEILRNEQLNEVLKGVFGGEEYVLLARSIVLALPRTGSQTWHEDGGHLSASEHLPPHCLNVFLSLLDLTPELGPTELRPGSHYLTRDLTRSMLLAKARKTLRPPVTPMLQKGDALLFDYRTLHRGTENRSDTSRPVLVLTYAKSWFNDIFNFPHRSIFPPPLEPLPASETEQQPNHSTSHEHEKQQQALGGEEGEGSSHTNANE